MTTLESIDPAMEKWLKKSIQLGVDISYVVRYNSINRLVEKLTQLSEEYQK